jgi:sugar-specific transcriptional regulator TrmB
MLTRTDIGRIQEQLHFFGANPREASIYIQCLKLGASSVQEIARTMKMNRVTVHSSVEQMIEKGLLFETRKGKRRLIVAEEPMGLLRLLVKKEQEITRVRGSMEHILKLLTSLQATDQSMPTVKLYEGVDGFKKMLEETLSARGEILVFSYVPLFSELVGVKHLDDYFRRRSARGIHTRLLFPPCDYAEKVALHSREYKIQVRTLPPQYVWQSGIFSWNDSLALMSYTERHLTCTIIENREIAYFFRMVMFEMCWKQGHRLETKSNGKDVII